MEVDDENIVTRKCYKLEQPIYENLNIVYNSSNSMLVLWNKYQIFIYENLELQSASKIIVPQFQVKCLIALNNHLVCLDNRSDLHIASLKFKSSTQKNLKIPFQKFQKDIKTCINYRQEYILSLKYEAGSYCLNLHRISSSFNLVKIVILLNEEVLQMRQNTKEKYILAYHTVDDDNIKDLKSLFKLECEKVSHDLVVLSLDNFSVYGCLFNPKMEEDELKLVKLYSCPAEICNLEIVTNGELHLIISLKMGTVIRITLNDTSKAANIVHFNTAFHKTLILKDHIIYTDGSTLWKSENTFNEPKFTQYFIKDANDVIKCGDQIICTTFAKFLYAFSFEDENAVLIPKMAEYCPAEKLLNNYDYFNKIFEEVDKNNELVHKLTAEQDYISALALSNKQNVVEKTIESSVQVYENYEDINKTDLFLTEELKEYCVPKNWLFLIKVSNSGIFDVINKILSNLAENIRIYVTLSSENTNLKTTVVKLKEPLKRVNLLLPLDIKNYSEIHINIKILIKIPGALDSKPIWTVLYRNNKILNCEHFIKMDSRNVNIHFKNMESIEGIILKNNIIEHGSTFEFKEKFKKDTEWSFYVKLPKDYEKQLKNEKYCQQHFNPAKSTYLLEKLATKEFLNSKSSITFMIGNENFTLKIQNDGFSNPLLQVSGRNIKEAHDLRNFFAKMLYDEYDQEPRKEFISSNFYTATENLQKAIKDCITKTSTFEEFLAVMDKFEKHIIGNLPL